MHEAVELVARRRRLRVEIGEEQRARRAHARVTVRADGVAVGDGRCVWWRLDVGAHGGE